jgi:hypothetical protein
MIGGIVTDVWRQDQGKVSVAVYGDGCFAGTLLCQNEHSLSIRHGDTVWWQMDNAFWTPQDGSLRDVSIPRIGYSYSLTSGITPEREQFGGGARMFRLECDPIKPGVGE